MKIKCIAVDDEPLALSKMENFIGKIPFLKLCGTFSNGIDTLEFLKKNSVDLMFLDIQMNDLTGIQLLEVIKKKPVVIFTTAYDKYAIKSYELDICDYLLKPIPFNRFLIAVNKAYDLLKKSNPETNLSSDIESNQNTDIDQTKNDFIFLKTEYRMQKVEFDEILYIQGMKDYLLVKTPTSNIMTIMTFKKMEEMLPKDKFIRTHKSFIVPLNKIESIERNRIKIAKKLIPISETYKKDFYDYLQKAGIYTL